MPNLRSRTRKPVSSVKEPDDSTSPVGVTDVRLGRFKSANSHIKDLPWHAIVEFLPIPEMVITRSLCYDIKFSIDNNVGSAACARWLSRFLNDANQLIIHDPRLWKRATDEEDDKLVWDALFSFDEDKLPPIIRMMKMIRCANLVPNEAIVHEQDKDVKVTIMDEDSGKFQHQYDPFWEVPCPMCDAPELQLSSSIYLCQEDAKEPVLLDINLFDPERDPKRQKLLHTWNTNQPSIAGISNRLKYALTLRCDHCCGFALIAPAGRCQQSLFPCYTNSRWTAEGGKVLAILRRTRCPVKYCCHPLLCSGCSRIDSHPVDKKRSIYKPLSCSKCLTAYCWSHAPLGRTCCPRRPNQLSAYQDSLARYFGYDE